jgi:proteasome lid subunit RPN8/RPN11
MAKNEYLIIPKQLLNEIVAYLKKELPNEAVGLLAGASEAKADTFMPLKNIAGYKSFLVDPYEQFKAYKKVVESGKKLIGVFHSHPDGGTEISEPDIFFARQLKLVQLIISLPQRANSPVSLAAYDFSLKDFAEIPIYTDVKMYNKIATRV